MSNDLKITLVQTNLYWEDKTANLAMLQQKIEHIAGGPQVVVLPEMFSTGFSMNARTLAETMDGPTVAWMKTMAASKKIILTGSLIIKDTDEKGNEAFYNRLVWMLPNGQCGIYNKRHLFTLAGENEPYTAGDKRLIASVNDWKINLQICYDLRFPVWSRQSIPGERGPGGEAEYDVLIYVANWPDKRSHAWKTLLQARAIENQCYVVGVNRVGTDANGFYHSGDSMVVDPLGEVLYHKKDEEAVFSVMLDKAHLNNIREKLPFGEDADQFKIF